MCSLFWRGSKQGVDHRFGWVVECTEKTSESHSFGNDDAVSQDSAVLYPERQWMGRRRDVETNLSASLSNQ